MDDKPILWEKFGREATVKCCGDCVIKTYQPRYFRFNEIYGRRGEAFYLQEYPSSYFPRLLESHDGFIVMPNYGDIVGVSHKEQQLKQNGLDYLELVRWADGLRKELYRLQLVHRDINPANILYNKIHNKYTLIDFGWMIKKGEPNGRNTYHRKLNPYAKSDNEALDKITINAIQILLSRIGSEGYRDGSSVKKGWTYHPIPFEEFKAPVHKTAAIGEYQDVLNLIGLQNKSSLNILDIGCSVGYFSFQLAKLGHLITGIEADSHAWEVAEAIRIFKGMDNINFINAKLNSEVISSLDTHFDLIIMLNVHMWVHKQLGDEKTRKLMMELSQKTKYIIFQTAGAESGGKYRIMELKDVATIKSYLESCGFVNVVNFKSTTVHGGVRHMFSGVGRLQ